MPRTKCKTIKIEGDKLKTLDKEIEKAINDFFLNESFEYVNHSLERVTEPRALILNGQPKGTILYELKDDNLRGQYNYVKGAIDILLFFALTIVYIDYSESDLDVTDIGIISNEKVKRSIKERKKILKPDFTLASDQIKEEE